MDIKVVESEHQIYQKQKLLGQGAFGKAYLVKRKSDSELLVIKQMNIDHMSPQQQKQTIKQAQILRNLNHPNIVKFVQVYVTKQNKLKIVMEYAQCGDLSKAINDHKKTKKYFDQNWILDWFTQICLAIKHVHDRKILHRDIKGQNIFITKTNTLKLGDFGIARVLNKTMQKARTVVGTPYYLSPQIIENKPYSFQSDIWSIGVVLYELCALTHPFTANSLQFLALKIVKGSFTPIPNQYSKQLRSLVNSMLSLDPNRRPTINQIFKNPLIQDRIKNFLTATKRDHQFSHTILHNHKVQILTNRLVQIKQQKDFQKQRLKLKQQQQLLRQKIQQKKSQQRIKKQQELNAKQADRQRQFQRQRQIQRQRSVQKLRQKQKQQQNRKQLLQKQRQRKQFQRKQSVIEQQKRKQQAQRKMQKQYEEKQRLMRQYEQKQKMAKFIEQKRKQENQMERLRLQHQQLLYKQSQRQEQLRKAEKMRKVHEKQLEQEQKKKQLQEFARKQFFQNQQIMRRAKQRAQQEQNQYKYQPSNISNPIVNQSPKKVQNKLPHFGQVSPSQNFHYKNNNQKAKSYEPTQQQLQNAYLNPNFNKNSKVNVKSNQNIHQSGNNQAKKIHSKQQNLLKQQIEKKHLSVRDQMRKDRQNFAKNKNSPHVEWNQDPITNDNVPSQIEKDHSTIRAAKWQRPKSRQGQTKQILQKEQTQDQPQGGFIQNQTYGSIQQKLSPSDQANFNQYLLQLQNILQNVNKNVDQAQSRIKNQTPQPVSNQNNIKQLQKYQNVLSYLPQQQQIIYRQDDHDTLKFSLTAQFKKQAIEEQQVSPQIQASTDLDYFSDFSKLQILRMNLQDKFGTDNFVQLYRYLQSQMEQKGLQAFADNDKMVEYASKKFSIDKDTLSNSITLLLTLIHMESKTMG